MMNRKELPTMTSQKSYYGKAKICLNGTNVLLLSYNTFVAKITKEGEFVRLWDGYSATTQKHINSFRMYHGMERISKKEWENMEVGAM